MPTSFNVLLISAATTIKLGMRDRTIILLAVMFIIMVLVSAYLGWSATATVNHIYEAAVPVMKAQGITITANPVGEMPPLSLFRNMVTYVALLGALAALVLGYQAVAVDRKAGVVPLLFARPIPRVAMALGKMTALLAEIIFTLALAALINILTMLFLPGLVVNSTVAVGLIKFYGVSALYMLAFSMLGALCAAACKSEAMALLLPVTTWLALTFILPQVTANIGPMAALNPLSANLVVPTSSFFIITSTLLEPLSIAEAYRYLAASILDVLSGAGATITRSGALVSLLLANAILAAAFISAFYRMNACRSEYVD